jgi:hypothetical protein
MKRLRYLVEITLLKSKNVKQSNGTYIKTFNEIDKYKVVKQNLQDQISATIYGANIDKMLKISTPLGNLENYLLPKVDNKEDNISLYFIQINDTKYKIKSVTDDEITIERL